MKTRSALVTLVGLAGVLAVAQTPSTDTPPAPKNKITLDVSDPKAGAKKDPSKDAKKDPKADAKKKKEDEIGKIEGMEIARANGTFLGLRIVDGYWRLTFYNAKKKPVTPDVSRAAFRWPVHYQLGDERMVLNPGGDDHSLASIRVVKPPFSFKLFITLLATSADGNDAAVESFSIDYRG